MGYVGVEGVDFRSDDGVPGQIIERLFGVEENNLPVRDLGTYELKGFRKKSGNLTLFHKTTDKGLTPIQMFDRFGYVKASNRNPDVMKKKLFTTIDGKKFNSLNLKLFAPNNNSLEVYHGTEFISGWDLSNSLHKPNKIIMCFAETQGTHNTTGERFHFVEAYRLEGFKDITELVNNGSVFLDLCIDQELGSSKGPHDRGPHVRVRKSKLKNAFKVYEKIL